MLLYGGAFMLMVPTQEVQVQQISWPMHLGGFIGGAWACLGAA